MKGVNYVTDEKGAAKALLIDFSALRKSKKTGADVIEFMEDLEDLIDAELSKDEKGEDWEIVKKRLQQKGKLSNEI